MPMKIILPGYFWPSDNPSDPRYGYWKTVIENAASIWGVIVNVNSGPGPLTRDANYVRLLDDLGKTPIRVFGYVASDYGRTYAVQRPIDHVRQWEEYWGVTSIFVDEAASGEDKIPYYATLNAWIKGTSILNHGVVPDVKYLRCGDILCSAETAWSTLRTKDLAWTATHRDRMYHIVMGLDAFDIGTAMRFVHDRAGYIFVSNFVEPEVFTRLPTYWTRFVAAMRMYP